MSITRPLIAALAVAALAVPAAYAQPVDKHLSAVPAAQAQPADMHASVAQAAAEAREKQNLRSADARDTLPASQPVIPSPAVKVTDDGSGADWTAIGLGVAGGLLAISGLAALGSRSRRTQRLRLTTTSVEPLPQPTPREGR